MVKERLGTYISEYSEKNKNNEPFPVYSVTNSNGFCTEYFNKDVSSQDKRSYKIVPKGYFAYKPSRINVGSVDCQRCREAVIVSPLYTVFKVSEKLNQDYLMFFFKSDYGKHLVNSNVSGSVRSNLKFDVLSDFLINIESIEKQVKIVDQLKKIESLISCEEKKLDLYDELIKSRFIEMFGMIDDFSTFEKVTWNDVVKIQNGRDYKKIQLDDGGYPVYGTGGEMARCSEYLCPENTIIIGRKGTINNPLLVKEKFWNVDTAFGVIPQERLNHLYFYYFCKQFDFSSLNKQAVLPSTTKTDLLKIEMKLPPLGLQNEFALFVEQIDKSKFIVQKRIDTYKELLAKKMDEYFN